MFVAQVFCFLNVYWPIAGVKDVFCSSIFFGGVGSNSNHDPLCIPWARGVVKNMEHFQFANSRFTGGHIPFQLHQDFTTHDDYKFWFTRMSISPISPVIDYETIIWNHHFTMNFTMLNHPLRSLRFVALRSILTAASSSLSSEMRALSDRIQPLGTSCGFPPFFFVFSRENHFFLMGNHHIGKRQTFWMGKHRNTPCWQF